jgi:prephenate dehydratase
MRVAFLGPAGTNTHDALRAAAEGADVEEIPCATVHDAIAAVESGDAALGFVPFENSIEGAVRSTLDTLAFEAASVRIAGEHDHAIHHALIAAREIDLADVQVIVSHEQANAQCARFLREHLPHAQTRVASSTAEAARVVASSGEPWAAVAPPGAAELYGGVVIRDEIGDEADNVTRFVWVAPADVRPAGDGRWRTTLIFSELGADHPGALVEALTEFSSRDVNLTRLESRPLRRELGRYMFFVDIEGAESEPPVSGAIEALRGKAENVRVLGSYPVNAGGVPGS